jgi:hypothetical protein
MKGLAMVFMLFFWLFINTLNTYCLTKLLDRESKKEEME